MLAPRRPSARAWIVDGSTRARRMSSERKRGSGVSPSSGSAPTRGLIATRSGIVLAVGLPSVRTRRAVLLLGLATALPRLAALLHERGAILASFTDKGDDFARTFLRTGTYGFIPGHPSAYTQPLYGFFLVPLYWIFGRHWEVVGLAQIAIAIGTALLVYEIGRRLVSSWAGIVAAVLTTIHPYLVWHDVHLNREILDQFLAAGIVLLTLVVSARPTIRICALLGVAFGLAILGNVRLAALPLVVGLFVLWQAGWS